MNVVGFLTGRDHWERALSWQTIGEQIYDTITGIRLEAGTWWGGGSLIRWTLAHPKVVALGEIG